MALLSPRLTLIFGCLSAWALGAVPVAASPVVLVTGATGRTGQLLYKALRERGVSVRGLVRNVTKARELIGCDRCDTSEGIFVGDVSKKETLVPAMQGATALAILTSAVPVCKDPADLQTCAFPQGGGPEDIDWNAGRLQIATFAEVTKSTPGHVVTCSAMTTTDPKSGLETLANGHQAFFKVNADAFLLSSGLPYTIVQPCALVNAKAGERELLVGHNDDIEMQTIPRADVARVMLEAFMRPMQTFGLRFDLCSRTGTPTSNFGKLFQDARYPWQ